MTNILGHKILIIILLFIITFPCSTKTFAVSFIDTFETGNFTHNEDGVQWFSLGSTPGEGVEPQVITPHLCKSKCVKFEFIGNSDLDHEGNSFLRFYRPLGFDEAWIEWSQYFPSTWTHRDGNGSDKNQFFHIFSDVAGSSIPLQIEIDFNLVGGVEKIQGVAFLNKGAPSQSSINLGEPNGIAGFPAMLDKWLRMKLHLKTDTSGPNSGEVRFWIDDNLILDNPGLSLGTNPLHHGRFMGRASSGFTSNSMTYIDNVMIANRPPISIVLVLDISGSMGNKTNTTVASAPTKLEALKKAVELSINAITDYMIPGDKVGVIFFDQDASPRQIIDITPINDSKDLTKGPVLNDISDTTLKSNLISMVNAESLGGATSIGDGLLSAHSDALIADINTRKLILLFTDGKQNSTEMVNEDTDFNNPSTRLLNVGGTPYSNDYDICVISVGMGTQSRFDFNSKIAKKRCGETVNTTSDAFQLDDLSDITHENDLYQHFSTILEKAVYGDKLEKTKVINDSFVKDDRKIETFLVSKNDIRMSIALLWNNPALSSHEWSGVQLVGPDGDIIVLEPGKHIRNGNQSKVITFPIPLDTDQIISTYEGEWKLILNPEHAPIAGTDYGIIFSADNATFTSKYNFDGLDYGTGDEILIKVKLADNHVPVSGANVIARVESPHDSVGNVLSTNEAPTKNGDQTKSPDPLSPAEQKLQFLLTDPHIAKQLRKVPKPDLTLVDSDGDGIYTGKFNNTRVPGTYNFTLSVEAYTDINGKLIRTQKFPIYVRPKPDPSNTKAIIKVKKGKENSGAAILTVTPFDKFGNYLGPGYADLINVDVKGNGDSSLRGAVVDNLDGTYAQNIYLSDLSDNPTINVTLRGEELVNKKMSELMSRFLWLWLLLLLILSII